MTTPTAPSVPAPSPEPSRSAALDPQNPFAQPSSLPYELPDYAAIRTEHYVPAVRAGMASQRAALVVLAASDTAPSHTLLDAFERSGALLRRAATVFYNQLSADASPELEAIEETLAPELAAHSDAIYMDAALHARFRALADRAASGGVTLADDQAWLLANVLRDFRRAGVELDAVTQERVRELNARTTSLQAEFSRKELAGEKAAAVLITDEAELAGLSPDAIEGAAQAAADQGHEGAWLLSIQLPTHQRVVAVLDDPEVRARVQRASESRGATSDDTDTRAIVLQIARLRAETAALLGYAHWADYVAEVGTARTGDAVAEMLARLAPPAVANARREAAELVGPDDELRASDWSYRASKARAERFALDEAALRPYLELDRVVHDGVFRAAHRLYGLSFVERPELVGYHPDVRVFEVFDGAVGDPGEGMGLFLGDWYTRASKRGGAWMNNLVDQNHLDAQKPVVVNNLNIVKPPPGRPTLLSWDEVITAFHEFGHALHGLLSDVRYPSQSGTDVPRDFVEYPSQVNEMWAWEPEILRAYAVHHETSDPMPAQWVDTLLATRAWGEGFATTEYLAATLLDQAWHRLRADEVPTDPAEVAAFEQRALEAAGVAYDPVPPRYRTAYFNHVFASGYSAAYYSYIWAEVLDADTVEWFREHGGLTRDNGDRFRAALLSRGGSGDAMGFFEDLRGRAPEIGPLLARRGLA